MKRLLAISLGGLLLVTCGYAQLSRQDRDFVHKAAVSGLYEVQANTIGRTKATMAEVKQHSRHMVMDHTKANAELMRLARSKGMRPPTTIDAKHRQLIAKLRRVSGTAFNREHVKQQVAAHKQAVALFKKQAKNGDDAELRAWAANKVMALETHLDMWLRAEQELNRMRGGR